MFGTVTKFSFFLVAAIIYVRADPTPTAPAPATVFIEGQSCTIGWDADPTGTWKQTQIDLMTGDNFNMVYLTTVAVVDTTDPSKTTYSYTCPKVTPHSPIYFYQFSSSVSSNKSWTGRFTITDSASDIVPPTQSTQPDGEPIPWGTGALVNGSTSSAPSTSGSSTAASSASGSSGSSAPPISPTTPASSPTTLAPTVSTPTTSGSVSVLHLTTSVAVTVTSSAAPPAGTNGAMATFSASNVVFQTGLMLGLAAFGFAVVF